MTIAPTASQTSVCTCSPANNDPVGLSSELEDWLTPDDLVQLLRGSISVGTLRNYRSARIGPAYVRVGRGIFYPRREVDAWLAEKVRESEDRWNDRF